MASITTHPDLRQCPRLRSLLILLLVIALMPAVAIVGAGPAGAATAQPDLGSVRAALARRGIQLATGATGVGRSGTNVPARSMAASPETPTAPVRARR